MDRGEDEVGGYVGALGKVVVRRVGAGDESLVGLGVVAMVGNSVGGGLVGGLVGVGGGGGLNASQGPDCAS